MKTSVVIATYNGEKYIRKQLCSILEQTIQADEVILVDDGSKDKTVSIITEFIEQNALKNWTLYQNKKNLGYKANFKKAFSFATGDIIILSDQDDIWEKEKVEEFLSAFSKQPDALAINASFRFIDGKDDFVNKEENHNNNNLLPDSYQDGEIRQIPLQTIVANNISPGCTMAVSKDLVQLFLVTTTGIQPHDWELNLLACLQEGLYFYNKKLTRYRIHGENEIGMTTDLNTAKPTPNLSYQQRCHNISERMKLKELFEQFEEARLLSKEQKQIFLKLHNYDTLRYRCVVEHKFWVWPVMLFESIILSKYKFVRIRELIGDLFFSLKSLRQTQ